MIVYGRNPVREAIRGRRSVHRVWATKNAIREPWLAGQTVPVSAASAEEIEQRCGSDAHQGVCAEVEPFRYVAADELLAAPAPLIVALDQVQDPQNLGAIARSAECAGASGLVIPERRAVEVTAAVCKASAGAVEHLPVAQSPEPGRLPGQAKAAGCWCYGADRGGPWPTTASTTPARWCSCWAPRAGGCGPRVAAGCDAIVSIPMRGRIDSLSVSAAAAVLLYAAVGRRSARAGP